MKKESFVSVIMNCYNGERYLRKAIDGVLAQTHQNWELIFWDNQSTDRSAEIFKSYPDPRLKYFYAPKHTWLYEARNYAIEKAGGEFFAFHDVDDWWMPSKLEKQIPLFSDPQVGLVCSNYWVVNEKENKPRISCKREIPTGWVLNDFLKNYFVGLLTLVVRRAALESLSYACDPRYHIMGDFDLVVRLAIHWRLDCVQEPVAYYRRHDNSETSKHRNRLDNELECWLEEMSKVDSIRSCSNLHCVQHHSIYLKAINRITQASKKETYSLFHVLPWGKLKLKLLVALFLPPFAVRKLYN
jgi:glycosyltransferase involved in cell wall biosynthesis